MNSQLLAVCLAVIVSVECKINSYCSICQNHTMCQYEGLGPDCEAVGDCKISDSEQSLIVDVHNWFRSIVASGQETRGTKGAQPSASNMTKLVWDDDLAEVAQRWADQCKFQHDTCRHDPRWRVGQNLYWSWHFPIKKTPNWTEAISSWYNEVDIFDSSKVESYEFEPEVGHYTQMVWDDTYLIGCGIRCYGPNKLYVCNYGPTGNWIGEPIYSTGEPCSSCPHGSVCNNFLCETPTVPRTVQPSLASPTSNTISDEEPKLDLRISDSESELNTILHPPNPDATSIYEDENLKLIKAFIEVLQSAQDVTTSGEFRTTTVVPTDLDEIMEYDNEIKKEFEDLKKHITKFLSKVQRKRKTRH